MTALHIGGKRLRATRCSLGCLLRQAVANARAVRGEALRSGWGGVALESTRDGVYINAGEVQLCGCLGGGLAGEAPSDPRKSAKRHVCRTWSSRWGGTAGAAKSGTCICIGAGVEAVPDEGAM